MSNETIVGNATMGISASAGLIATVNNYAVFISLSLTVVGLLIGLVFHLLALKDRRKRMNQDRDSLKAEILKEIIEQSNSNKIK